MLRLIGDIGGTNARLALARDGTYAGLRTFLSADYPGIEDCIEEYLAARGAAERPQQIALAVAAPVDGDLVSFTNHPWKFRKSALKKRFGVKRLDILNDFTANAVAVPWLEPGDFDKIGGGTAVAGAPSGILGPGTGLGVSGLLRSRGGKWIPIQGEGGHASMPAVTDRESAVIQVLRRRYGHVSAERILSGDGLVNLYDALCTIDGKPSAAYKPAQITDPALAESDKTCREAVEMFCAALGTVAGDLALTLGASGGIYIAGGIVPRLGARFAASGFRSRFEDKGRFRDYVARIPTFVISHTNPALLGLARLA